MEEEAKTPIALLRKWKACGERVAEAIDSRDYPACRKAAKEASSVFERIASLLENELESFHEAECKKETLDCVELWRKNAATMPDWLEDNKKELDGLQRRITTRRKLGNIYGGKAPSSMRKGIRVKVKAR
jgi:hypothetical protein